MFKVFVSYSTHDLRNVNELQQSLDGTGVEVFVAEHSVLPSEHLSAKISSAISACDLFVLLWSENAKASEWVSQEIGKAHSLHKKILPLVLTEGLNLPGFISNLKYLPEPGSSTPGGGRESPESACPWGSRILVVQPEVMHNPSLKGRCAMKPRSAPELQGWAS